MECQVPTIGFWRYYIQTIEANDISNTNSSLLEIVKGINQVY